MVSKMERVLHSIRKLIPKRLFVLAQPVYHFALALLGALLYRFPSRNLRVIGVTGTKGKTTVAELAAAIFTEAGYKTALANTIHFKIGSEEQPNQFKMTMPGRFFLQRFLYKAVQSGCTHVVLEVTSEGIKQFRHRFIDFDAVVFTNLAPEHIESHGSFEAYGNTKLQLAQALERSGKRPRFMVANADDVWGQQFLKARVEEVHPFSLSDARPYEGREDGAALTFRGTRLDTTLPGTFSVYNVLAAATVAAEMGVSNDAIKRGVKKLERVAGRAERIEAGQPFPVVVDYAHTPDSLEALYKTFEGRRLVCVLGSTGGGRDTWKRPAMGTLAEHYCHKVFLTNEDPYDEDPEAIIDDVASGMRHDPERILDRRGAIRAALDWARRDGGEDVAVLITGKGTDPYIMEADGARTPWSDARVAREEMQKLIEAVS